LITLRQQLGELLRLHHVAGKAAPDLAFEQALQQFDGQIALGQVAHLGEKGVVENPDVRLVEADRVEHIDDLPGNDRRIDDLADGQFALLIGAGVADCCRACSG
jgi:hypothetical protein